MNYEFFAEFAQRWDGHENKDWGIRLALLCEAFPDKKKIAQSKLRDWILNKQLDEYFKERKRIFCNLISYNLPNLEGFPVGSFTLQFTFCLEKPYISLDDTSFYIIDNPVKKERIFKLPYISASQWKGILRSAVRQMNNIQKWEDENEQMIRIFGNIKSEEENKNLHQGALHFYPTFFDRIGLEVINPHDRETGTGKNPIYFETVPAGASGEFQLLYFNESGDKKEIYRVRDLLLIVHGVHEMMTLYGIGAKVSSGFGRVGKIEKGVLKMKVGTEFRKRIGADEGSITRTFGNFEELESIVKEILGKMEAKNE